MTNISHCNVNPDPLYYSKTEFAQTVQTKQAECLSFSSFMVQSFVFIYFIHNVWETVLQ